MFGSFLILFFFVFRIFYHAHFLEASSLLIVFDLSVFWSTFHNYVNMDIVIVLKNIFVSLLFFITNIYI